ncbi:GDYXXLXY domain-containing protein, partial [Bordetella petrii]|uniref:GDYXXLXY domain-containing protein n=1 Tax=Bordetella petrii TaxID=94624 RepID=UPI001E5DCCAA
AGKAMAPPVAGAPVAELGDADAEPQLGPPWYVQGLLGLSAWLTTLLLLLFLFLSGAVQSQEGAMVVGLVLCAVAVAVLRTDAGPFWRQCATAMGFAGQILVAFGLSDSSSQFNACTFVLLLGVAVYALAPEALLRFLSAWMIALAGAGLIWLGLVPELMHDDLLGAWLDFDTLRAAFIWQPVAVTGAWAAAVAFCLGHRLARTRPNALLPLAWAFVLAVQGMVWLAGGTSVAQLPAIWQLHPVTALLTVAGAVLPVACALAVLWPRRRVLTAGVMWGVPLGLLALSLFWLPSPGIAFALAWMLLGFGLNRSRLAMFGGLSLLAYLVVYYYQLQVPLLDKALWLGGAALLLFLLHGLVWLVPRLMRTAQAPQAAVAGPASPALRWRTAVVLGGLVLAAVVVNGAIWQRETLLAHGRVAILALAPVDPRSLMQGDYMALRFEAGDQVMKHFAADDKKAPPLDGYVVLVPDSQGVAQVARIQSEPQPQQNQEIALRYRLRGGQVRIVTNAYFFPEGQADRYAAARYGELRVGDDGTGLLVRMLGEDKQPL